MVLLDDGDVLAIEVKYHRLFYIGMNCHYNVIGKQDIASENGNATTENEMLQFIKEEVSGGR